MGTYKIKIENFKGPLDLLLQLIEQHKLEITEISLSEMTDSYLAHIEKITNRNPEDLSDFLVVAARLLVLKSAAILPDPEIEESFDDLEKQLKIYKEFLDATKKVEEMIKEQRFTYSRLKPKFDLTVEFSPPKNVEPNGMRDSFLKVLKRLDPIVRLPRQMIERSVSLHQRINSLKSLLDKQGNLNFKKLFESAQSKTEVIVNFLAVLELTKQRVVILRQASLFDDITIERVKTKNAISQ